VMGQSEIDMSGSPAGLHENEELVSRGVFIALVGGVVTGLTKFFFFP